jgi:cysteinyl-tRNA synthetase
LQRPAQQFLRAKLAHAAQDDDMETFVAEQIAARVDAKQTRNFAEADRIRAALLEKGIILEDKPGGLTEWRRA